MIIADYMEMINWNEIAGVKMPPSLLPLCKLLIEKYGSTLE